VFTSKWDCAQGEGKNQRITDPPGPIQKA